jgi:FkbM family methyltransferase
MGATFALGIDSMNWGWLRDRLRKGSCVYDIGANRGQSALFFARAVGPTGTVISFEPVTSLFDDLTFNLRLNALCGVRPIQAAVADTSDPIAFAFSDARPTQGKMVKCEGTYAVPDAAIMPVNGCTLDALAGNELPPPDFLKIDVEGGAACVLRGAQQMLRKYRPGIYIELHGPEEQAAVKDLIQAVGYAVRTLDGKTVLDPTLAWLSPLVCDPISAPCGE